MKARDVGRTDGLRPATAAGHATEDMTPDRLHDWAVEVDRRTGIAYTRRWGWDYFLDVDELSPWRSRRPRGGRG